MPFDTNGNFNRVHNWTSDYQNDIEIVCDRHDAEDDNFADGLTACFCKDGRSTATGNFKMGNYRITGLGNGQAANDAVNKSQLDALNTSLTTAIATAITNCKQALFPVGSVYATIGNTNPNTLLGFGTWSAILNHVVVDIAATAPVKGNGITLGLTNGTDNAALYARNETFPNRLFASKQGYGDDLGTTVSPSSGIIGLTGLTSDGTKSGVIADTSSLATQKTVYLWRRTA